MNPSALMEQRDQALAKGNDIRYRGAALRREIAALPMTDGLDRVCEVLKDFDDAAGSLKLANLLRAVHRISDAKVGRMALVAPGFNPARLNTRLRDLTYRERAAMVLAIREHGRRAR